MLAFPEVEVIPYRDFPATYYASLHVPTLTKLFRKSAQLDTALPASLIPRSDKPSTVLSIGSSIGAEADSVLAYAAQIESPVHLVGVDPNLEAVKRARDAKYVVPEYAEISEAELQAAFPHFDVATHEETWFGRTESYPVIDTSKLREAHNVEFLHGELDSGELSVPEADIILCNNVLYHLSVQQADKLLDSMIDHLKPGGLLSLGSTEAHLLAGCYTSMFVWTDEQLPEMASKQIEPAVFDDLTKIPFAFRKPA